MELKLGSRNSGAHFIVDLVQNNKKTTHFLSCMEKEFNKPYFALVIDDLTTEKCGNEVKPNGKTNDHRINERYRLKVMLQQGAHLFAKIDYFLQNGTKNAVY